MRGRTPVAVELTTAIAALLVLAVAATLASAQGRPRAGLAPLVGADGVAAGSITRLALEVSLPEGLHVQSDQPRDALLIPTVLSVDAPAGLIVRHLIYPVPTDFPQEGQAQPLAVFEHVFVAGAEIELDASVPPGELVVPGRLRYQACDDKVCFAPLTAAFEWRLRVLPAGVSGAATNTAVFAKLGEGRLTDAVERPSAATAPRSHASAEDPTATLARFTVLGTTGGYIPVGDFLQFLGDAERGVRRAGMLDGRGPLAILVIVLLGGLALNLTPCVLPMLPINLAIIGAGAQAGSRRRGFVLGLAYGGAMALVYGVLGLVVILTAGTFGTINASPWFNLGIAVLFVVLALAMFDVIAIDLSTLVRGPSAASGRGSLALAFTMGAVAALLAGACVAPVVIQVVLLASSLYAGGATLALILPFVLGVGMALPWPIAGAGIAALPRPGPWMVRVKQVMGSLILATAIYYGYLAYGMFANRWVDPAAVAGSVEAALRTGGWTANLGEGLARAEREGRPVFVDFWATWCKNCLTMDETTFADPRVKTALARYVKVKFQAEDPDAEPAKALMERFKAVGLPTYVVLRPATTYRSSPAKRTGAAR